MDAEPVADGDIFEAILGHDSGREGYGIEDDDDKSSDFETHT